MNISNNFYLLSFYHWKVYNKYATYPMWQYDSFIEKEKSGTLNMLNHAILDIIVFGDIFFVND